MRTSSVPFDSDALRANLGRTAQEVVIPDRYLPLLAAVEGLYGVRTALTETMGEYFHTFRNADLLIEGVQTTLLRNWSYFDTTSPNYGPPVAVGMGVAGGAYSGRAAVSSEQIDQLLADAPDENIVLLRPDTVPEDIAMIARVSGILTARGGTTSHAAVTAKRLGKTAVVECVDLEVIEQQGSVRLAGTELQAGDWLSIDGRTGNIFLGRIPTMAQPALVEPH